MAFLKPLPEAVYEEFGSESELDMEPQIFFVGTAAVEFVVVVKQNLEV